MLVLSPQLTQVKAVLDALHCQAGLGAEIDAEQIMLLGDGFSATNDTTELSVPLDLAQPHSVEPLGATIALLATVFDERVRAVAVCNGLVSFRSVLTHQFIHIPYDAVVPKALVAGDMPLLGAAIVASGRTLIVSGLRDALNRLVPSEDVAGDWQSAIHVHVPDDVWQVLAGAICSGCGKL